MNQDQILERITCNPEIFTGKPIIRGRRLAVEHTLDMLAAGDDACTILQGDRPPHRFQSRTNGHG